jgi:hypothetical protein
MEQIRGFEKSPETAARRLLEYCRRNDWAGIDPYDILNSRLIARLKLLDSRWPRLVLTQLIKRCPVNLRPVLGVPSTQNPKALAVFLAALINLKEGGLLSDPELIGEMVENLESLRSPGSRYWSWGYSFPWQTRTEIVPRGYPNLVCTVFVANALLDCYDALKDNKCLDMARAAAEFILSELYWRDEDGRAGFGYPLPSMRSPIHNANFLGAALLGRIYQIGSEDRFLLPALMAARYSVSRQKDNGSWYYGELSTQRWIDNFHTGYNLVALDDLGRYLCTDEFKEPVQRGFRFYRERFFRDDGAPRYYHDRDYPVDSHCVAQSLITLAALKLLDPGSGKLARAVLDWALAHLWDRKGYFYYQAHPLYTNRLSYMRWTQAWMLLALSSFIRKFADL